MIAVPQEDIVTVDATENGGIVIAQQRLGEHEEKIMFHHRHAASMCAAIRRAAQQCAEDARVRKMKRGRV